MQVFGDLCVVSYWIDTLVLKTEGNTYATLLHHLFLFKGKPTQAQEVAHPRCRHRQTTPIHIVKNVASNLEYKLISSEHLAVAKI